MTLLEEVIELDTMLANDGYKSWGYARLTLDKVIKALTAPPDVNQHVMQAEGSDVSEGATVASEGREKHVRGGCIDRTRKKDGPCCYPVGTCYDCQVP
jgi:hypothetical protein